MTLQFHAGTEIQRPGFVFSSLKRHLPDALVEEIKRMSLTADGRSAVFDVPTQHVKARSPGLSCFCPRSPPNVLVRKLRVAVDATVDCR